MTLMDNLNDEEFNKEDQDILEKIALDIHENQAPHEGEREQHEDKTKGDSLSPIIIHNVEGGRPTRVRNLLERLEYYVVNLPKSMEATQGNNAVNMKVKLLQSS